jgi:hypothetical protein
VDELSVTWPDGSETTLDDVRARRTVVLSERRTDAPVCAGGAPSNECITGGISSADCMLELAVSPTPPRDPRGVPARSVRCRDGEACDADGVADGACTFSVSLCINTDDPRLRGCTPGDVQRIEITAPRRVSRKELERSVYQQLATAFGPGGELGIGLDGPLANISPNHCTEPLDLAIPLGSSALGAQRATRIRVGFKARSTDRRQDSDVISLQCLPGVQPTQMAVVAHTGG